MADWNFDPTFEDVEKVNMYGFTPCPKCRREQRCEFNDKPGVVQCDDCGFDEPVVKKPIPKEEDWNPWA